MAPDQPIFLKRDCEAVLIPSGMRTVLAEGTEVVITQSLGGSYTVIAEGSLARIAGKDADALGKEAGATPQGSTVPGQAVDEKLIWDQMRTCYDPEIPVNI